MLRSLIVLPDGTEIFSGQPHGNAIRSATLTQTVNSGTELELGSTCSSELEISLYAATDQLQIDTGTEITYYKVEDDGTRVKIGLFTIEKPTQTGSGTYKFVAYDRVSWLDKDLTDWLWNLYGWPYTVNDFAEMVCSQCGLTLSNTELPNGSYLIQKFSADGITGRQLMQWVGQIAGRFCRATADGLLEFAWYSPVTDITIGPRAYETSVTEDGDGNVCIWNTGIITEYVDGNVTITGDGLTVSDDGDGNLILTLPSGDTVAYYQNSLSFADYQVAPIGKVQIKSSQDDVGTVWPQDVLEEVNTYIISGNYLLSTTCAEDLKPIAQTLYEQLKSVTYTPCKVSIPAGMQVHAGDIITITDRNGVTVTAYVMTKKQSGQRDTLECTGSARRDSSSAVNEQSYKALSGKVLDLQMNVDGLKVENRDAAGKLASLALNLDGLTAKVQGQSDDIAGIAENITQIQQNAQEVKLSIQSIQEDGVEKVQTETGYTFDENGLNISKDGSDIENLLNETGMYVKRNEEVILQANNDGVEATDVSVRNYLIIGDHARFENYSDGSDSKRTACFWI